MSLVCSVAWAGTWSLYANDQVPGQLLDRLERLEQELNVMQRQFYRGEGVPTQNTTSSSGSSGMNTAQIEVRLSEMEEKMRSLVGSIEQNEFAIRKINERVDAASTDNDFRFKEIEKKLNIDTAHVAGSSDGTSTDSGSIRVPEKPKSVTRTADNIAGQEPKSLTLNGQNADSGIAEPVDSLEEAIESEVKAKAKPSEPAKKPANKVTIKDQYAAAYQLYTQKKYAESASRLEQFITQNPKDPLSASAYYYLGESYSKLQQHPKAVEQYLKGYKAFPQGAKAADSLYKSAISLFNLKKNKQACVMLNNTKTAFPESDAAKKADIAAKKMKCT